jgi:hypothetical protein
VTQHVDPTDREPLYAAQDALCNRIEELAPTADPAQVVELATALDKLLHGPAGGTIVGIYRYPNEERRPTGFGAGHNGAGPH